MSAAPAPLVSIRDVRVAFGGIVALDGVSFEVEDGRVTALIGPNGAGKTTLFNCLSRLYRWNAGSIHFAGQDLAQVAPHRIAQIGIGRTFQNLALFGSLSVLENVLVGHHPRGRTGFLANALRLPAVRAEDQAARAQAHGLLRLLDLEAEADRPARALPFAIQKRVEIARALMADPRLLLLDEPACGLNHAETEALARLIRVVCEQRSMAVLLVEHHMNLVMAISDHVVALNFGRKIAEGAPDVVRHHAEVIQAYLGRSA